MFFVPITMLSVGVLSFLLIRWVQLSDMSVQANRLFGLLIALYAVQSLLLTMRWGYGFEELRPAIGCLAAAIPVCAYLAFRSMMSGLQSRDLWTLAVPIIVWGLVLVLPTAVDPLIILIYVGFGVTISWMARSGDDAWAVTTLAGTVNVKQAMVLTGAVLILSAATDLVVMLDFMRSGGRSVGVIVAVVQSLFLLLLGAAVALNQFAATEDAIPEIEAAPAHISSNAMDEAIVQRLADIFRSEHLHRDYDLSLRRLSRRLQLPDRVVSNAVNRVRNISVSQFVNEFRVNDAREMLKSTDRSILQVSLDAGFMSKSNFNREFARVTGCSPSQWRAEQKSRDLEASSIG